MITFMIDEITPCLKDCETGELLQTEVVELKRKSFLSQFHSKNGWYVNWSKFPKKVRVFALVLKGTMDIQGLVAVSPNYEADSMFIDWACTAPHNNIHIYGNQKYNGVGGHLFAIASELSMRYGFGGWIYGYAMNQEIYEYYINHFGANPLPRSIHPYGIFISGEQARKIREVYDYDWTDEII